jgi:undecaprenyl-diphosphatase
VAQLRESRIVHHRLSAGRMILDGLGTVRIVDFADAEIGASDRSLAVDVAEVLAATAARVGPDRAVAAARMVLGTDVLASALPRLQPLALTPATRSAVRHAGCLPALITEVQDVTGVTEAPLEELRRIKPTTLLVIATTALAGWLLVPQILRMGNLWTELRDANWWWAAGALGFAVLSYLGAAIAFDGSVPDRVPFVPNVAVQFASGLVGVVTTGASLALGARFLQRRGVDSAVAVGAMGVNTIAGMVVHVSLVGVFIAFDGTRVFHQFKLSSLPTTAVIVVLAVVVALVGVLLAVPVLRRLAHEKVMPPLRRSAHAIVELTHRPTKIVELFGGSAIITLANVFALVAAVEAFGGGPAVVEIALVYLVGSAISNAAPTPGAIGATEAALTAGLAAAGMASHIALAAVLMFRVATFWLPLLPGWITFTGLQRAGDI